MPITRTLPDEWYNTANIHLCTIKDFVNFSRSKNILPEVQYSISENFNPNNINCIAIGKIEDNSNPNEYKSLDKVTLIRHAIYGHLSPKNYQDIELHKVAFVMKSSNANQLILKNLL